MKKMMITLLCSFAMLFVWMLAGSQVQAADGAITISGFNAPKENETAEEYNARTTMSISIGNYTGYGKKLYWTDENDVAVTKFERGKTYIFQIKALLMTGFAGEIEDYRITFDGPDFHVTQKSLTPDGKEFDIFGTYSFPEDIVINGFILPIENRAYSKADLKASIGNESYNVSEYTWWIPGKDPCDGQSMKVGERYNLRIKIKKADNSEPANITNIIKGLNGVESLAINRSDTEITITGEYTIPVEPVIDLTIPDCCIGRAPGAAKYDDTKYSVGTYIRTVKDGVEYDWIDDNSLKVFGITRAEWEDQLDQIGAKSFSVFEKDQKYIYQIQVKKKDETRFSSQKSVLRINGIEIVAYRELDDFAMIITDEAYVIIPKRPITKISLSASAFYYDGKAKYPTVTVNAGTEVLASKVKSYTGENFVLTNKLTNKKPGTYTVKAVGKGSYGGLLSKTYKIKIKPTKITKLSGGKKSFTARFTKQAAKYITGYQIRYSLKSSMAKAKTATIKSYKTVTKKISRLKSKKKYYVQIRTYKTISGKKYYSGWSAKKTVKTK